MKSIKNSLFLMISLLFVFMLTTYALTMDQETANRILFNGVICNNLKKVNKAIAAGAAVNTRNYRNETPLHDATWDSLSIVQYLIAAGADINAQDKDNLTPLHEAVSCGDILIIQALVAAGANVNARNESGNTPLDDAILLGRSLSIIQILIAAGADIDASYMQAIQEALEKKRHQKISLKQKKLSLDRLKLNGFL